MDLFSEATEVERRVENEASIDFEISICHMLFVNFERLQHKCCLSLIFFCMRFFVIYCKLNGIYIFLQFTSTNLGKIDSSQLTYTLSNFVIRHDVTPGRLHASLRVTIKHGCNMELRQNVCILWLLAVKHVIYRM